MAKHRTHSIEFKRQVAQEFLAGETLHGLAKRHDVCRNLIRVWVQKYEAGDFDEDAAAADLLQQYAILGRRQPRHVRLDLLKVHRRIVVVGRAIHAGLAAVRLDSPRPVEIKDRE
jgi:transposase-like protein